MRAVAAVFGALLALGAVPGRSAERQPQPPAILVHAGKSDSLSHALAVQFAAAIAQGNNALTVQVAESQGSVRNIIDSLRRSNHYLFTAPPNLIIQAQRGEKPFKRNARYREIRALFPIPPLTMHWVVRADTGIRHFSELAGNSLVPGAKASFSERQTIALLHALGLEQRVQLIDIDPAGSEAALAAKQVAGEALAGTVPLPRVTQLAKTVPLHFLSLRHRTLAKLLAGDDSLVAETIPKGTYAGQDMEVRTVAQPTGVYTTTAMSSTLAYAITKAFWSQRRALAQRHPAWNSVSPASLATLGVKLHPGALRYYREAGIRVPQKLR